MHSNAIKLERGKTHLYFWNDVWILRVNCIGRQIEPRRKWEAKVPHYVWLRGSMHPWFRLSQERVFLRTQKDIGELLIYLPWRGRTYIEHLSTLLGLSDDPLVWGCWEWKNSRCLSLQLHQWQYPTNRDSSVPIHQLIYQLENQAFLQVATSLQALAWKLSVVLCE